jgi:hypothetical protein
LFLRINSQKESKLQQHLPMQQQYFAIDFNTKPFLKKYLESCFGTPIKLGIDSYIGMSMACVLEKNVYSDRNKKIMQTNLVQLNCQCKIYLPISWLKHYRYGTGIEEKKQIFINNLIEYEFERELCLFVQTNIKHGVRVKGYKEALEMFAALFNLEIDQDITYENLRKIEYRFRKNLEQKFQRNNGHQKQNNVQPVLY